MTSMAHLGLTEGDPSFASVHLKLFASTFADQDAIHAVWARTLRRSPLASTFRKATDFHADIAIV